MPYKFSIAKQGYVVEEVDKYVKALETKLKSYKEKENLIQQAIISAQAAADQIVYKAQMEARDIQQDAAHQLEEIKYSIYALKEKAKSFQNEYNALIQKYTVPVSDHDSNKIERKFNELIEQLENTTPKKYMHEEVLNEEPPETSSVTEAEMEELL